MFSARKLLNNNLLRKNDQPSDETSTRKGAELLSVILGRFGMEVILWSSSICVTTSVLVPDEEGFIYPLGYLFGSPFKKSVMKIKCKVKLPSKITLYSF